MQMKATEQYFPVVMFIIDKQYQRKYCSVAFIWALYKVVLSFCLWMTFQSVAIQMKATEQNNFPVVFSVMRNWGYVDVWVRIYSKPVTVESRVAACCNQ